MADGDLGHQQQDQHPDHRGPHDQAEHRQVAGEVGHGRITQVGDQDQHQPAGDAQPVLGPPGLDAAQDGADPLREPAGAVDGAVDDLGVEPPQGLAQLDAAAREDRQVQLVDVELVHAGGGTGGSPAERDALHEACRRLRVTHVEAVQVDAQSRHDRGDRQQQTVVADELEGLVPSAVIEQDARPRAPRPVEDLLQPGVDRAALRREAEQHASQHGGHRQDDQRRDHGARPTRGRGARPRPGRATSMEGHVDHAERVEGGHEGHDHADT